jgi:hypothetical protein
MLLILVALRRAVIFNKLNFKLDYIYYARNLINVFPPLSYYKQCIDLDRLNNNIYSLKILNQLVIFKKLRHFKYGKNIINKIIIGQLLPAYMQSTYLKYLLKHKTTSS